MFRRFYIFALIVSSSHCSLRRTTKPISDKYHIESGLNKITAALSTSFGFYALASSIKPSVANAITDIGDSSFYERFPYQNPYDILKYIKYRNPASGDSKMMLSIMDDFASKYPMYKLSQQKAAILNNAVSEYKPKNVLEIGTFFGYSAVNILEHLQSGSSLTCIEANDANAEIAKEIILRATTPAKHSNFKLIEGISSDVIASNPGFQRQVSNSLVEPYDFIFLDHDKESYVKDLRMLETNNMIAKNCIIVADNVVFPGAPGYLEYVGDGNTNPGTSGKYKTKLIASPFERVGFETKWQEVDDAMSLSLYVP
eukprot:gene9361-19414_t